MASDTRFYTTTRRTYRSGSPRQLESVTEHVLKGGLPVEPQFLSSVRSRVLAGEFNQDRTTLVREVKSDPGLYAHTARSLHSLIETSDGILPERELLRVPADTLRRVYDVSEAEVSTHKTREMSRAQALRLQSSIIASRTAEVLAPRAGLDADLGYSASFIRQLGLNYMAWNYPVQYARALEAQKHGRAQLDGELTRLIGISPLDLARRIAAEWHLHESVRAELSTSASSDSSNASTTALSLHEVCELADLFARANDSEHFPEAKRAWAAQEPKITARFGDVRQAVAEKVSTTVARYHHPKVVAPTLLSQQTSSSYDASDFASQHNAYLRRCPPEIRQNFTRVYESIEESEGVSVEALRILVDEVIPAIGFLRGCVYLLDEIKRAINPALRIGDLPKSEYQSFKTHQNNLVTTSLDSTVPILQRGLTAGGKDALRVCGSLGSEKRPGVLYLELNERFFESTSHDPLLYFHAVRKALRDCLLLMSVFTR